jgi:hypothetical protein
MDINFEVTKLQNMFIKSEAFLTLFGGAAGGGKSYGLLIKYFLRCMRYPGYQSLILRRTFPELQRSLIRRSLMIFPKTIGKYNESKHVWTFLNDSIIEFGYCDSENDVTNYQSAEYDAIGFDESTHFTEFQITYMISRIRGVNNYPKSIDLTTNPGGVSHGFHKKTIIANCRPFEMSNIKIGERFYSALFIPAKVTDNKFLMDLDPEYKERLDALPEFQRKMLRDGDWDTFEGQFFPEMNRDIHVIKRFDIPENWKKFRCMDYGLDMLKCYWIALDTHGNAYVYRGLSEKELNLTAAAKLILSKSPYDEDIMYTVASPDLWKSNRETGVPEAETMIKAGLKGLIKADNSRVRGWREVREWITPYELPDGTKTARLKMFDVPEITRTVKSDDTEYTNLFDDMCEIMHDEHDYEDATDEPHKLTHGPEALRYGIMSRPSRSMTKEEAAKKKRERADATAPANRRAGY